MNHTVRELLQIAESLGFRQVPDLTGTGHILLRHRNGSMTLPSTPSEYRGRKNAIAAMERIARKRLPRPNHRKGRKQHRTDFDLHRVHRENQSWHDAWDDRVAEVSQQRDAAIEEFRQLREDGSRTAISKVRDVLHHIEHLERKLTEEFHQPVEPFNPLTD